MTTEEQNLIEGLFDRLRQADVNPRDPEAEQLIRANTAVLPSAPCLLAQAVIVQEHALTNAQARIAELENRLAATAKSAPPLTPALGAILMSLSTVIVAINAKLLRIPH